MGRGRSVRTALAFALLGVFVTAPTLGAQATLQYLEVRAEEPTLDPATAPHGRAPPAGNVSWTVPVVVTVPAGSACLQDVRVEFAALSEPGEPFATFDPPYVDLNTSRPPPASVPTPGVPLEGGRWNFTVRLHTAVRVAAQAFRPETRSFTFHAAPVHDEKKPCALGGSGGGGGAHVLADFAPGFEAHLLSNGNDADTFVRIRVRNQANGAADFRADFSRAAAGWDEGIASAHTVRAGVSEDLAVPWRDLPRDWDGGIRVVQAAAEPAGDAVPQLAKDLTPPAAHEATGTLPPGVSTPGPGTLGVVASLFLVGRRLRIRA